MVSVVSQKGLLHIYKMNKETGEASGSSLLAMASLVDRELTF